MNTSSINKLITNLIFVIILLFPIIKLSAQIDTTNSLESKIPKIENVDEIQAHYDSLLYPVNGPMSIDLIGDPYIQHNFQMQSGRKKLDWYGSGDVNNDGKVDSADVVAIDSGDVNYRGDVDGDGVSCTTNDKKILVDYLNGKISHLPGDWNKDSEEEKNSWLDKMEKIVNVLPVDTTGWICQDYVGKYEVNFDGWSNFNYCVNQYKDGGGADYTGELNAYFNIPFYFATDYDINGNPHALGAVSVGKSDTTFSDWRKIYIDWNNGGKPFLHDVKPGDSDMNPNKTVAIGKTAYISSKKDPYFTYLPNFITFYLTNGKVDSVNSTYRKNQLTISNPLLMKTNFSNFDKEIVVDVADAKNDLSPEHLEELGFNSIPETQKVNTPATAETKLYYRDFDTTFTDTSYTNADGKNVTDKGYSFNREIYSSSFSGGFVKIDSTETPKKIILQNITGINDKKNAGGLEFKLFNNYPNPFNPSTVISYQLPVSCQVSLKIYDIIGREVATLVKRIQTAGDYHITFHVSNLPSGIYFYRLQAGNYTSTKKLILLK